MNVRVSQQSLHRVVRDAQRATASRSPMPILKGIKLDAGMYDYEDTAHLDATGTDLHVGVQSGADCTVNRSGEVVVDAETFSAFVSSLDKLAVVDLETRGTKLVATSGRSTASFSLMPAEDYPSVEDRAWTDVFSTETEVLTSCVAACWYATSSTALNPALTGISLLGGNGSLTGASTDGWSRFSIVDHAVDGIDGFRVIVPVRSARLLEQVLVPGDRVTVSLADGNTGIRVRGTDVTWWSSLIEGKFPDVRRLIPETSATELVVDRYALLAAALQVKGFRDDANQHVALTLDGDDLSVSSPSVERGSAVTVVATKSTAGVRSAGIFVEYTGFVNAVQACGTDDVSVAFGGPRDPVVVRPVDGTEQWQVLSPTLKGGQG